MSVVGIGVDVVVVERFTRALERTPALKNRLFSPQEQDTRELAAHSWAARFAAKEATLKALGGHIVGFSWHDIAITGEHLQPPALTLRGGTHDAAHTRGVTQSHLSLSHDAGVAMAFVVLESGSFA
jgi:holo-[acyl-carrier protein] synthase